jgi:hypothetical protein
MLTAINTNMRKMKLDTEGTLVEIWRTAYRCALLSSGFGGLVVSMPASGTQDCRFAPGRSRRIFQAKKSSACLPSEGK